VYSIDLSILFTADPGAIYRVEVSYKKEYSLYDCDEALLFICKQKVIFSDITKVVNNFKLLKGTFYQIYNKLELKKVKP